jgi:hypothetical protein
VDKYTTASANVSASTLNCAGLLHIVSPVVQPLVDEGVASRKPLDEVFVLNIVDGNVQMLVAFDQRRFIGKLPVYDRDNVRDLAIGECLWTSE